MCTGDDHNPLGVPEVPQPPRLNDPSRMFVPGNNIFVSTINITFYALSAI